MPGGLSAPLGRTSGDETPKACCSWAGIRSISLV
jgi:hypothetical protein